MKKFEPQKFEIETGNYTDAYVLYDMINQGIIVKNFVNAQIPKAIKDLHEDLKEKLGEE